MLEFIVRESVVIPQPSRRVWKALTDPKLIRKYFFGTEVVSNWKVGSSIVFRGVWEGKPYEDKGKILAIEEGKFLKYNYWSSFSGTPDVPANYSNITYTLTEENGSTTLAVTQDNCKSADARDHSANNWRSVMEGLAQLLAPEKSKSVSVPQ